MRTGEGKTLTVLRPDITGPQFRKRWRSVPALQRLAVWCLVPPYAIDVPVVYGAGHMPALTHELLRRYGYRPRTAEWLTVFDF
jgi:hypothetical protein